MRIFAESKLANRTTFVASVWAFYPQHFFDKLYAWKNEYSIRSFPLKQNGATPASTGLPQLPQSFPQ
jgi:hypothetical protein